MGITKEKLKSFSLDLYKIDAIKFGEYQTKIGVKTPIYCDLRVIVSHPKILETLTNLICQKIDELDKFDVICGVPYTALPIATAVSLKTGIPMVVRRKERKDYGTKKLIEGSFEKGAKCLVIEDVVTSGSSVLETVTDLKSVGIDCNHTVVLLNRQQGGADHLSAKGVKMHALLTLTDLVGFLREANLITDEIVDKIKDYLTQTQITKIPTVDRLKIPFDQRAKLCKCPVGRQLFELMQEKQTNLCLAADVIKTTDLLNLAESVGPYICLLKTHIDIIEDFHPNFLKSLKDIAKRHNFLLFEDRKFADIGHTVKLQYTSGIYKIGSWAQLVTAHSVTGRSVLDAIRQSDGGVDERGVFLLAETSAADNLIDVNYTKATIGLAVEHSDIVVGIVCQSPLFKDVPNFIQLIPGVKLNGSGDGLGQQYNTPEVAVGEKGGDIGVVGRGIIGSENPAETAKIYRDRLWKAYLNRISL